jgi:beta-galactosidase
MYSITKVDLPFYIDISEAVKFGVENSTVVKLDNRDNPLIPPGKPLKDLDFNYYQVLC